jgi:hypothetical protein
MTYIDTTFDSDRNVYAAKHSTDNWQFLYLGEAFKRSPQISLHADGDVVITATHHTDEEKARLVRKMVKAGGHYVGPKTFWNGSDKVKLKRDATRYTQDLCIEHGTTTINIILFVELPR